MNDETAQEKSLVAFEQIENKIYQLRGQRIMLDTDLADVYAVETKVLNQAVKRNLKRFPEDFMFQLSEDEAANLPMRSQSVTASKRNIRFRPYAFTEHGAVMLATILKSPTAIEASLQVVRAFVRLRTILLEHQDLASRIEQLEKGFGEHDKQFGTVFAALKQLLQPAAQAKRQIGFTRQEATEPKRVIKKKAK